MMRRILVVVVLVIASVAVKAEWITHSFQKDFSAGTLAVRSANTIGYYEADGTVYTCKNGAEFAGYLGNVCIVMDHKNESVVISPAKVGLTELDVVYYGVEPTISVSTDSITWVPIGDVAERGPGSGRIWMRGMSGNYYIWIKNTSSSNDVYIQQINYTLSEAEEPGACNCFPVVFE